MAKTKKTTKKVPKLKVSKAAQDVARALLEPTDLMRAMAKQLELQAKQLDQMNDELLKLVQKLAPAAPPNLITEPMPPALSEPLNG